MTNYKLIINRLGKELSEKVAPGPILDEIMFRRIEQFGKKYKHNKDLLMIGALLADIRIDEAKAAGDIKKHVPMSLEYAEELFKQYSLSESDQKVILEIIATHHGGDQVYIESKIFKNADNFKFLETRGAMHYFGALYAKHTPEELEKAIGVVINKLDEKLKLTDLDTESIEEATELYKLNTTFLRKIL